MDWTRASEAQYDAIEALGNPGWNYESLQYYMKRAEHFFKPTPQQASTGATFDVEAHGFEGNVGAGFVLPVSYFCRFFAEKKTD